MLSCKEATSLASQRLDRRLGLLERLSLRLHLAVCDGCSRVAKQFAFLRTAVKQLGERDA
ncbi:MAG: zf-HC2 domain-containing protein [Betaproteobacteria bacterium]|nr:zf-HC2 domain-containing protein [Betaproteobacteria bacterium]